jgi:hypothetical protein
MPLLSAIGCLISSVGLHSCSPIIKDDPFGDSHRTVKDSLFINKEKGLKLFLYYYDGGVFGRSQDYYLAIDTCSCKVKADSAFFTSRSILKIFMKDDTANIILGDSTYKMIDSTRIPTKITIDEKTWRYVK